MKKDWLITFRSITFAQKAERQLKKDGIACLIQKTPKGLSERGCSYSLRIPQQEGMEAAFLLKQQQIPYGKVFMLSDTGVWEAREA